LFERYHGISSGWKVQAFKARIFLAADNFPQVELADLRSALLRVMRPLDTVGALAYTRSVRPFIALLAIVAFSSPIDAQTNTVIGTRIVAAAREQIGVAAVQQRRTYFSNFK
jgi:hypothetical protein